MENITVLVTKAIIKMIEMAINRNFLSLVLVALDLPINISPCYVVISRKVNSI